MKKYEFTGETLLTNRDCLVHRIKALKDIPLHKVKAGDLGGFIYDANCLDEEDACWVADEAIVYKNSRVTGDALLREKSVLYENCTVNGNVFLSGEAQVWNSTIEGSFVFISDRAKIIASQIRGRRVHIKQDAEVAHVICDKDLVNFRVVNHGRIGMTTSALFDERITFIQGRNVGIMDDAQLEDVVMLKGKDIQVSGSGFLQGVTVKGDSISIADAASVTGDILVGSHVSLRDVVSVTCVSHSSFDNVELAGDKEYWAERL